MSTRSRIGLKQDNGSIKSIYCHWDGYPEGVGTILKENYTDLTKIKELLELGDLSILGKDLGEKHDFCDNTANICTAYGRDRGELGTKAQIHDDFDSFIAVSEEYNYLYEVGFGWSTFDNQGNQLK